MEDYKSGKSAEHRYEELYTELLSRGDQLHESNKRRIRRGIILLIILPFVLEFIRWITDSDKVVFLIIWIFIMFAASAYLISIEYLDSAIEKTLQDVTDTEAGFDGLLPRPELPRTDLHVRILERVAELRAERADARSDSDGPVRAFAAMITGISPEEEKRDTLAVGPADSTDNTDNTDRQDARNTLAAAEAGNMDAAADLSEAEEAMRELRETMPADIITAMEEAFAADKELSGQAAVSTADDAAEISVAAGVTADPAADEAVSTSDSEPETYHSRHARKEDAK